MIKIGINEDQRGLHLVINGATYEAEAVSVLPVPLSGSVDGVGVFIAPRSEEVLDTLLSHRLSEFPSKIWTLELRPPRCRLTSDEQISYSVTAYRTNNGKLWLGFDFLFDAHQWKQLWSISEYLEEFERTLHDQNIPSEIPPTERVAIFPYGTSKGKHTVMLPLLNADAILKEEILRGGESLEGLHNSTRAGLLSRLQSESVIERFNFPEAAKTACEQYLVYFVQFLKDVGVEATAELRHEATEVLFAVTPKNKDEALDKIRTALNVYLNLSAGNLDGAETDIVMQRLAANVYHLRSQLALAQALIQSKNATIQAQQVTLAAQQLGISNGIILDSLIDPLPDQKREAEPVFDGLAEITKYEGKGFNVNLPEIFRRLKKMFEKRQE